MKTFTQFDDATDAKAEGEMVCGTLLKTGEPVYFVMPSAASDEQIRNASFEIREGREWTTYEEMLLGTAKRLREDAAA